jgi:hypothetical protein
VSYSNILYGAQVGQCDKLIIFKEAETMENEKEKNAALLL